MVSTKMTAVLAVALLLLCSSGRSSAQEMQGTITQVKVSDSPTTAPAITNTTEGSSDSHSAVLANEVLGTDDNGPLVLVDLARSDQENMTSMSATPPTADSVPSGFDMSEPDDTVPESFAESTTPPAVDTVPAGFDMTEFDDDSQSLAATHDQGTLVQGYPTIGSSEDNSQGVGYGVVPQDASVTTTEDDTSFAVSGVDPSLAATHDQGTLVQGYPTIGSSEDNSQGVGYGVVPQDASTTTTEDDTSFAVSGVDPSFAATRDQGTLVQGYPAIGSSADNSQGVGYGVVPQGASVTATEDDTSFASEDELSFAGTQDEGSLVRGYPEIGSSEDNSRGPGYGVLAYDESASGADSFSAYQEDEYPLEHEDTTNGPGVGVVRPYGPFYGQP